VGQEVLDDFFIGGFAAGILAVGNDVDDAAAFAGLAGELLGRVEDGVVEGMDLFGQVEDAAGVAALGGQGWVCGKPVDGGAGGEGPVGEGNAWLLAWLLSQLEGGGKAIALSRGPVPP